MLKEPAQISKGKLSFFDIGFIRPIYVGENIEIYTKKDAFEVVDSQNRLLAAGPWK